VGSIPVAYVVLPLLDGFCAGEHRAVVHHPWHLWLKDEKRFRSPIRGAVKPGYRRALHT